jgi:hypothetical protein
VIFLIYWYNAGIFSSEKIQFKKAQAKTHNMTKMQKILKMKEPF